MPDIDFWEFDGNLFVARRFESPPWPCITRLVVERINFLAERNKLVVRKDWIDIHLPEHGYIVRWSDFDEVYLEADPQRVAQRVPPMEMKRIVEEAGKVKVVHCELSPKDPLAAM